MKFWLTITQLVGWFNPSVIDENLSQRPLPGSLDLKLPPSRISGRPGISEASAVSNDVNVIQDIPALPIEKGPNFKPPSGRLTWEGSDFECEYPEMRGYRPCSSANDRTCWLYNNDTGHRYDIKSNYEDPNITQTPIGKLREYTFVVEDGTWNADGFMAKDVKLVNGTYPGPWLQACWGDTIRVKVINKLKHNGTAIHWHGIRQLNTMHMDGVPGITQCPIAPNDYFVYEFRALQYGSSWYHSHYSVQYADGLLGPMTIHGPTTDHWDEAKLPLLMSDWFHNSAFGVIHGKIPGYGTTVLNGTGDVTKYRYPYDTGKKDEKNESIIDYFKVTPNAPVPAPYQLHFQPKNSTTNTAKRYILRLINTSFATTFLFTIDHHTFVVIGADFVPVKPSKERRYLRIGIGQRYTVIVTADPQKHMNNSDGDSWNAIQWDAEHPNFWIRTAVVNCFRAETFPLLDFNQTGVLRYNITDQREPITKPWKVQQDDMEWNNDTKKYQVACRDEVGLEPQLAWTIPPVPRNNDKNLGRGEEFSVRTSLFGDDKPKQGDYPLAKWSFEKDAKKDNFYPLQIDYDNPFFLNLYKNLDEPNPWAKKWVVVDEAHTDKDWVFLTITSIGYRKNVVNQTSAAHPIHLHGHDFAVIHYKQNETFDPEVDYTGTFNYQNPIRRDVILLPKAGWITIAFKTDNPGSWIMHCHIAFHASEGLALQINERQRDAEARWPLYPKKKPNGEYSRATIEANRVCKRWKEFQGDCTQHWPGKWEAENCWPACNINKTNEAMYACPKDKDPLPGHVFQDDSGI